MDLERLAEKLHDGGWTENEIRCGLLCAEAVHQDYADLLAMRWVEVKLESIREGVRRGRHR